MIEIIGILLAIMLVAAVASVAWRFALPVLVVLGVLLLLGSYSAQAHEVLPEPIEPTFPVPAPEMPERPSWPSPKLPGPKHPTPHPDCPNIDHPEWPAPRIPMPKEFPEAPRVWRN